MEIYPKIDETLKGVTYLDEFLKKSKGAEIQLLKMDYDTYDINAYKAVRYLKKTYELEEVTIHMPIDFCDIELYFYGSEKKFFNLINHFKDISEKLDIDINILFHTTWTIKKHEKLTIEKFKKLLKHIQKSRLTILLENVTFHDGNTCTPLELCTYFDNFKLKTCIDICHIKSRAAIFEIEFDKYIDTYLEGNLVRHIKQFHFSNNRNNDGYKDKKTYSNAHDLDDILVSDINTLMKRNLMKKIFVTEINDDDYEYRIYQKRELELLEKVKSAFETKKKL